jgi:hypothetical protein
MPRRPKFQKNEFAEEEFKDLPVLDTGMHYVSLVLAAHRTILWIMVDTATDPSMSSCALRMNVFVARDVDEFFLRLAPIKAPSTSSVADS